MTAKLELRPVDADWTLIGYELIHDGERLGFVHMEDILSNPDPAAFVNEWVEQTLVGEGVE